MFSILEVKRSARASIKAALGSVVLVSLVYVVIVELLSFLSMKVVYGSFDYWGFMREMLMAEVPDPDMFSKIPEANPTGELIVEAINLMSGIIAAGFTYYTLLISRRAKAGVGDMFDIFNIFLKALGLLLLQAIYVMLWSMLFVIPGIIAAYRYSMAIYIMLDRPDVSIFDCIRMSKEMTRGNKGKLFLLDMSFIFWFALSYISTLLAFENEMLGLVAGAIVSFFFTPYYQTTLASVYNCLSGWQPSVEAEYTETPEEEPFDASSWYDN